jgi:hypothetical protein
MDSKMQEDTFRFESFLSPAIAFKNKELIGFIEMSYDKACKSTYELTGQPRD